MRHYIVGSCHCPCCLTGTAGGKIILPFMYWLLPPSPQGLIKLNQSGEFVPLGLGELQFS